MTEKDSQLIERARKLHYTQWQNANNMSTEADTDLARKILDDISKSLYHREEAFCDLL